MELNEYTMDLDMDELSGEEPETEDGFAAHDGIADVPVAPTVKVIRRQRDVIDGMDDEELASWSEMLRQVMLADYAPLMEIPAVKKSMQDFRQLEVHDGKLVDVSAFNTIDFDKPEFDKARYAAQKQKEKLKQLQILLSVVEDANHDGSRNESIQMLRQRIRSVKMRIAEMQQKKRKASKLLHIRMYQKFSS